VYSSTTELRPAIDENSMTTELKRVLHVGCGAATLKRLPRGFQDGSWKEIRFDINPAVRPDIVGTITNMTNVANQSVDAVYSSHNLEHVYAHEVMGTLREFRRVLKDSGFAVITCPDLQSLAEHMKSGKLFDPLYISPSGPISPIDVLYGHRDSIARGETYMAHRTGFSLQTLLACCKDAKFETITGKRHPAAFSLWAIATPVRATEAQLKALFDHYTRGVDS
jgi:SAM-dependent methyltransferase